VRRPTRAAPSVAVSSKKFGKSILRLSRTRHVGSSRMANDRRRPPPSRNALIACLNFAFFEGFLTQSLIVISYDRNQQTPFADQYLARIFLTCASTSSH